MSSSPTISLFSAQPELEQRPYSFAVSVLVHGLAIGLVAFGILSAPKVKATSIAERYAVRHLDLQTLYPEMQRAAASAVNDSQSRLKEQAPSLGGSQQEQQAILSEVIQAPRARHTIAQPDIPKPLSLPVDVPLPTVVIWNASKVQVKTIVAPAPQAPPVALMKPKILRPNDAPKLADIAIRPSDMPMLNSPILPSTTSPVVVSGPKPTPPAPLTTAAGSAQQASGAIMSLTDVGIASGHVTLPPVNQSASASSEGALAPGSGKEPSQAGHGNPAGAAGGSGTKQAPGSSGNQGKSAEGGQGGNLQGVKNGAGEGLATLPHTTRITRQKEGQFGAVVVGSSLQERYPEIADLWGGRMAYTVYLPVGLAKSWILQYSLTRAENAATGNVTHIEAPWPYSIVRPNIEPGAIDADALMVHGFVNQAGRFEAMTVAFPPEFAQAQFVLNALAQWQFRPATQNGQNVKVEVLLIIPEEPE